MGLLPGHRFPSLLLLLLRLLPAGLRAPPADSHSLCYNITVNPKARPGQQRCDVQGHVDDRRILHCDCSFSKISFFDPLGREVDAIDNWAEQTEMLRDVVDALNQQVAEMKHSTSKDPPSLQARMCCRRGASGGTHGSWQFSFDGQIGLLFDPDARMWTEVHPRASWMKTTWENDRQLTEFLRKVSMGDCTRWLGNCRGPALVETQTEGEQGRRLEENQESAGRNDRQTHTL